MEAEVMMDSLPVGDIPVSMEMGSQIPEGITAADLAAYSGMAEAETVDIVSQIIFNAGLSIVILGLVCLFVFPARANWRAKKEKVKVVDFVGFWRRVAILLVDVLLSLFIVPIFFNIAYYLRDGQTIADKIYGTKIVDKKSHATASVGQLMVRLLSKQFSKAALYIGFMAAGWRKEKLAWHDGLADVRYISYKKVHGIWTVLPFLLLFALPVIFIVIIGAIGGYQEAAMQAAEMAM